MHLVRLLQSNETISAERYQQELIGVNHVLNGKRPIPANTQRKVILLQENARPDLANQGKNILGLGD